EPEVDQGHGSELPHDPSTEGARGRANQIRDSTMATLEDELVEDFGRLGPRRDAATQDRDLTALADDGFHLGDCGRLSARGPFAAAVKEARWCGELGELESLEPSEQLRRLGGSPRDLLVEGPGQQLSEWVATQFGWERHGAARELTLDGLS